MAKYIDTDRLLAGIYSDNPKDVMLYIATFPAADVAEVKHGKWVDEIYTAGALKVYGHKCSVCGAITPVSVARYRYCPNCGASMVNEDV